jgi:regulator-associated protein of mTOR
LFSQSSKLQARVRAVIKPTNDDLRRLCVALRRHAKQDRLLLHYNGHGVPWPTMNGEIWVFDKKFTQYIPLSIFDLQTFVGGPTMYVFDCAGAGRIVYWYQRFLELREENGGDPLTVLQPKHCFLHHF